MRSRKKFAGAAALYLLLFLCALVLLFVQRTYAYFSDREEVQNIADIGTARIEVGETIENGKKLDVKVTNTGTVECYVRVLVTKPDVLGLTYTYEPADPADAGSGMWVEGPGGYLYYNGVLKPASGQEPGESAMIYDRITVTKESGTDITAQELENYGDVLIYAECVQARNIVTLGNGESDASHAIEAFEKLQEKE